MGTRLGSLVWPDPSAMISGAGRKGRGGRKKDLVTLNMMLLALPECWQSQPACNLSV